MAPRYGLLTAKSAKWSFCVIVITVQYILSVCVDSALHCGSEENEKRKRETGLARPVFTTGLPFRDTGTCGGGIGPFACVQDYSFITL